MGTKEDTARARSDEADRYRRAAEEALHQLDWCVNYLHGLQKPEIARVIAQNRSVIRRELDEGGRGR